VQPGFDALAAASFDLYPAYVAALRADSGLPVEYRTHGRVQLSFSAAAAAVQQARASASDARDFGAEWLGGDELRRLEPVLSAAAVGGLLVRRDASVDNRQLTRAAAAAARAAGAAWVGGEKVTRLDAGPAGIRLTTERGASIDGGQVVVAAGCWSGELSGLPRALPVRPIRGEIMAVRAPPKLLSHVIMTERCYLVPRQDGRILIGATVDDVGFAPGPTPGGLGLLAAAAAEAAPALAELPLAESWAGYRPGTPDGLPVIGRDPDVPGVVYATGHYRNGILLAPVTAALVAALLSGSTPPVSTDAFTVTRFG
jgi:glycine oxidase